MSELWWVGSQFAGNVLRIYEVRLNEIINYKQMLVSVSCIYDASSSNGLI